jgi:hypothetical protein
MNASCLPNDPWVVFNYEVDMFHNLCQLLATGDSQYQELPYYIKNAIVESAVLHTRIMVDILLSRGTKPDDINLSALAPGFTCPEIDQLSEKYGNYNTKNTPCWIFNKMLAHATGQRRDSFDYSSQLTLLVPLISNIVNQVNAQRI